MKSAEVLSKFDYSYGTTDLNTGKIDAIKNNGLLGKVESFIGANKQWSQRFGYDELGRLKEGREYRGDNSFLTYKQVFDFDRFGNLYRKAASNPTTGQQNPLAFTPIEDSDISTATLLDLSYEYNRNNSVGNLNGKTGHLTRIIDNLNTNKNREYEFDALGRLTKAKGGAVGMLWNQTYSYDRYGNRTNVTKSGNAADGSPIPMDGIPNLSYDNVSNRITTAGFQYDVAGNQIRALAEDGVTWVKYKYDNNGAPASANLKGYSDLDPVGNRSTVKYRYDTEAKVWACGPKLHQSEFNLRIMTSFKYYKMSFR